MPERIGSDLSSAQTLRVGEAHHVPAHTGKQGIPLVFNPDDHRRKPKKDPEKSLDQYVRFNSSPSIIFWNTRFISSTNARCRSLTLDFISNCPGTRSMVSRSVACW